MTWLFKMSAHAFPAVMLFHGRMNTIAYYLVAVSMAPRSTLGSLRIRSSVFLQPSWLFPNSFVEISISMQYAHLEYHPIPDELPGGSNGFSGSDFPGSNQWYAGGARSL